MTRQMYLFVLGVSHIKYMYVLNTSAELLLEMRSVMIYFIIHHFGYRYVYLQRKLYEKKILNYFFFCRYNNGR